ncbi:hypothetical protein NE237_001965 [Protea cynaroides]|uniref:Uncharacterized protein n=1 Tax=Protea cynaroides TaxID=273540 RepID=A0A9Q0QYX9_9MAGN|nr:hypothetical protein NE237_001965 [Protea cynaroides]
MEPVRYQIFLAFWPFEHVYKKNSSGYTYQHSKQGKRDSSFFQSLSQVSTHQNMAQEQPKKGNSYFSGQQLQCGGTKYTNRGTLRGGNLDPRKMPKDSSSGPSDYFENQKIQCAAEGKSAEFENDGAVNFGNFGEPTNLHSRRSSKKTGKK